MRIGAIVGGKYRVERFLGRGGMGVVVAAKHLELGELRAIKFMNSAELSNDASVKRFLREAQAASKLRSEHAVKVLDYSRLETGEPYIVMEYLDGISLKAAIQSGRLRRSAAVAVDHILQACHAMAEAHQRGIVHRDLKPENLFVIQKPGVPPCVKVLDFGLSKFVGLGWERGVSDLTQANDVIGTPYYMSPEQLRATYDVDARTDIWSLGVILYELVAGRRPFATASLADLHAMILLQTPAPPSSFGRPVPAELERVIFRCLEKDRELRPANAEELMRELRPFSSDPQADMPSRARSQAPHPSSGPSADRPSYPGGERSSPRSSDRPAARSSDRPAARSSDRPAARPSDRPQPRSSDRPPLSTDRALDGLESTVTAPPPLPGIVFGGRNRPSNAMPHVKTPKKSAAPAQEGASSPSAEPVKSELPRSERPRAEPHAPAHPEKKESHSAEPAAIPDTYIGPNHSHQNLKRRDLSRRNLVRADLSNADLMQANLIEADLRQAKLRNTRLVGADLSRANLLGADLRGAQLDGARLRRAKLIGAKSNSGVLEVCDVFGAALPAHTHARIFSVPSSGCTSVAFHPAALIVASVHADGLIRVWDADGGLPIRIQSAPSSIQCIAFSGMGLLLAGGCADGSVILWDCGTGEVLSVLEPVRSAVSSVAFSHDGRVLASGAWDGSIRLSDAVTGRWLHVLSEHTSRVESLSFSYDNQFLASGSADRTIRVWNAVKGAGYRLFSGSFGEVHGVQFVRDPALLLVSGSQDGTLRLWDVAQNRERSVLAQLPEAVNGVSVSPDGALVAAACADRTAHVVHWMTRAERQVYTGHQGQVTSVAFSGDGTRFSTGSADRRVRLWKMGEPLASPILCVDRQTPVHALSFHPGGKLLAAGGDDGVIRVWSLPEGRQVRVLTGHRAAISCLLTSPDGARLVSASFDNTLRVWNTQTGREELLPSVHPDRVLCAALSKRGDLLATGCADKKVRLFRFPSMAPAGVLEGHEALVWSVAFRPDGALLASGSNDKTLRLWNTNTGALVTNSMERSTPVWCISFRSDGALMAVGGSGKGVSLIHAHTFEEIPFQGKHEGSVRAVSFGPEGTGLLTGSDDKKAVLWNTIGNTPAAFACTKVAVMEGHMGGVSQAVFAPDRSIAATASQDGTVRLWSGVSGEALGVLFGYGNGWAAFTPEGRYKSGGLLDGEVWHAVNLCRFELGELDPYLPSPLRLPDAAPLFLRPH